MASLFFLLRFFICCFVSSPHFALLASSISTLDPAHASPSSTVGPLRLSPNPLLSTWGRSLLEKLVVAHVTKKFPAFCVIRMFITEFTTAPPPLVPILSPTKPVHVLPSCLCENCSHIILPSTPTSCKWSFTFSFPHQNRVCSHLLPIRANVLPISFVFIRLLEEMSVKRRNN